MTCRFTQGANDVLYVFSQEDEKYYFVIKLLLFKDQSIVRFCWFLLDSCNVKMTPLLAVTSSLIKDKNVPNHL